MRFAVHHNASVSNKWFNRLSDSLTYGRSGTKHSCSRALICTHTGGFSWVCQQSWPNAVTDGCFSNICRGFDKGQSQSINLTMEPTHTELCTTNACNHNLHKYYSMRDSELRKWWIHGHADQCCSHGSQEHNHSPLTSLDNGCRWQCNWQQLYSINLTTAYTLP